MWERRKNINLAWRYKFATHKRSRSATWEWDRWAHNTAGRWAVYFSGSEGAGESARVQWCAGDFFRQAHECPEARGMRAVGEREREIIWPGESLQPRQTAIKNIRRDEANGGYLSAEGKRGQSHLLVIVGAQITAWKDKKRSNRCCFCRLGATAARHIWAGTTLSAIRNNGVLKRTRGDCFGARNYGCWERILGVGKKRGDYEFQHIGGERVEKFGCCFLFPLLPFFRPFTRLNSVSFSLLSPSSSSSALWLSGFCMSFSIDIRLHLSCPLKLLVQLCRTSCCVSVQRRRIHSNLGKSLLEHGQHHIMRIIPLWLHLKSQFCKQNN